MWELTGGQNSFRKIRCTAFNLCSFTAVKRFGNAPRKSQMRNIFLLYMPPDNAEAMVHYQDTIRNKVAFERIAPHLAPTLGRKLQQVFGPRPIAVWGSRDSPANRAKFDRMCEGDEILIVEGSTIRLLGRVAGKLVSPPLSVELWKNLRGNVVAGWDLIYFIANPREIDLPFAEFCRLFDYKEHLRLRGLTSIAKKRLEAFYAQYDDLYSILISLKQGRRIEEVPEPDAYKTEPDSGRGIDAHSTARRLRTSPNAVAAFEDGAAGRREGLGSAE